MWSERIRRNRRKNSGFFDVIDNEKDMEIVHNLNGYSHEEVLSYLLDESTEFICCSPFLNKSVDLFETVQGKRIHLITTLKPNKAEQLEKVDYFNYLFVIAKRNSLDLRISIDNRLHGKVYIGKSGGTYVRAIVTSANLTSAGMKDNHEWGISFDDYDSIVELEKQVLSSIEYRDITEEDLRCFQKEIKRKNYDVMKPLGNIALQLVRLLDNKAIVPPVFASRNCTYWLKPLGSKEFPYSPNEVMDKENTRLDFAKCPKGVSQGDVFICYGVGVRKVLSVIKITDGPRQATKKEKRENRHLERWDWCMYGENMTLKYGCKWNNYNLTLHNLEQDFLSHYPKEMLTTKSQSLGALRYHSDKVRLNPNFACFIISEIMDRNS